MSWSFGLQPGADTVSVSLLTLTAALVLPVWIM